MLGISCGIWGLVPRSRIEARPPAWGARSLSPGPPGKSPSFFNIKKKIIYFWLRGVFFTTRGLSPVAASGGCSRLAVWGRLTEVASPAAGHGLQHTGCRGCGSRPLELGFSSTGLAALRLAASSWAKDWTHVLCIGRWILNPWTTKEVPQWFFQIQHSISEENMYQRQIQFNQNKGIYELMPHDQKRKRWTWN